MSVMSEWKSLSRVQLFGVHGILQARILEWVANLFSRESSQLRDHVFRIAVDSLPSKPLKKPQNKDMLY